MKYFRIISDDKMNKWRLSMRWKRDGQPIDVWSYVMGRAGQRDPKPLAYIERDGDRIELNFALGEGVPIVSSRVAETLAQIEGGNLERIPVTIEGDDRDWEIINSLPHLDAIDHSKSHICYYPLSHTDATRAGMPQSVEQLILDPTRIQDRQLFRLKEWDVVLMASERVLDALATINSLSGVSCTEVPTDSKIPGRMRIANRKGLVPWSPAEREAWMESNAVMPANAIHDHNQSQSTYQSS